MEAEEFCFRFRLLKNALKASSLRGMHRGREGWAYTSFRRGLHAKKKLEGGIYIEGSDMKYVQKLSSRERGVKHGKRRGQIIPWREPLPPETILYPESTTPGGTGAS